MVDFKGDGVAAQRAILASGGKIVDIQPKVGLALVEARDEGFLDDVRSRRSVVGAAPNHAVGLSAPGMPHYNAPGHNTHNEARPRPGRPISQQPDAGVPPGDAGAADPQAPNEPLAQHQWNLDMVAATPQTAHRQFTGNGVDVGIIDTGIDAGHPDLADRVDLKRSRNFTVDRPEIDGPCEKQSCVDDVNADGRGHGTHVAATVAAARDSFGMSGVAPDATLINLRAGQDSGYFFLYETVSAIVAAADLHLDVVNMSFYTDPWLYNCDSKDDYISGDVSDEELAQQKLTRSVVSRSLEYAHESGVTMVSAAGNEHTDLSAPERVDPFVPAAPGQPRSRTVSKDCLNMPSEGPHVLLVSSVGPSGAKADYSNYGEDAIHFAAPGGWMRDKAGTIDFDSPGNLILSAYPTEAAIGQGLADQSGQPTDPFTKRHCDPQGVCGLYTYMQGTSMASPHAAGVAALLIQAEGEGNAEDGYQMDPDKVAARLAETAADQPCPSSGVRSYTAEGRSKSWQAPCQGSAQSNGFYGEGIVSAASFLP